MVVKLEPLSCVRKSNKDTTTLSNNNLCVSFAGPQCKADDIIARDVKWLLSSKYNPQSLSNNRRRKVVIVITADQELIYRCRNAAVTTSSNDSDVRWKTRKKKSRAERMRQFKMPATSNLDIDTRNDDVLHENVSIRVDDIAVVFPPTVEVISPQRFLEDLDLAVQEWLQQHEQQHHNDSSIDSDVKKKDDDGIFTTMSTSTLMEVQKSLNVSTTATATATTTTSILPSPVSTISNLFQLRGRILKLESSLRDKLSLHKRSTTLGELRKCKVEWRQMLSSLNCGHDIRNIEKKSSVLSSLAWSLSSTIASLELYDNNNDNYDTNDLDMSQKLLAPLLSATTTSSSWERLSPKDQEKLLLHWSKERHSG
jgi:hypothetical protein